MVKLVKRVMMSVLKVFNFTHKQRLDFLGLDGVLVGTLRRTVKSRRHNFRMWRPGRGFHHFQSSWPPSCPVASAASFLSSSLPFFLKLTHNKF